MNLNQLELIKHALIILLHYSSDMVSAFRTLKTKEDKRRTQVKKREDAANALLKVVRALNMKLCEETYHSHVINKHVERFRITKPPMGVRWSGSEPVVLHEKAWWVGWNQKTNKFFLSQGWGSGRWYIARTILEEMGKVPEIRKLMADPEIIK